MLTCHRSPPPVGRRFDKSRIRGVNQKSNWAGEVGSEPCVESSSRIKPYGTGKIRNQADIIYLSRLAKIKRNLVWNAVDKGSAVDLLIIGRVRVLSNTRIPVSPDSGFVLIDAFGIICLRALFEILKYQKNQLIAGRSKLGGHTLFFQYIFQRIHTKIHHLFI